MRASGSQKIYHRLARSCLRTGSHSTEACGIPLQPRCCQSYLLAAVGKTSDRSCEHHQPLCDFAHARGFSASATHSSDLGGPEQPTASASPVPGKEHCRAGSLASSTELCSLSKSLYELQYAVQKKSSAGPKERNSQIRWKQPHRRLHMVRW